MNMTAQGCFPFNIHNAAFSHVRLCSNFCRDTEDRISCSHQGQSVNLPDSVAVRIHHNRAVLNHLPVPFRNMIGAVNLLGNRLPNMFAVDKGGIGLFCPVAWLDQKLGDRMKAGGQLCLLFHKPGTVVNHFGNSAAVKREKPLLVRKIFHKSGHLPAVHIIFSHHGIELHLHFEEFVEILIKSCQQIIKVIRTDHNNLDIQWNRLGLQTACRKNTPLLIRVFYLHVAGLQGPF